MFEHIDVLIGTNYLNNMLAESSRPDSPLATSRNEGHLPVSPFIGIVRP